MTSGMTVQAFQKRGKRGTTPAFGLEKRQARK
jgi:hypothetical protein